MSNSRRRWNDTGNERGESSDSKTPGICFENWQRPANNVNTIWKYRLVLGELRSSLNSIKCRCFSITSRARYGASRPLRWSSA